MPVVKSIDEMPKGRVILPGIIIQYSIYEHNDYSIINRALECIYTGTGTWYIYRYTLALKFLGSSIAIGFLRL